MIIDSHGHLEEEIPAERLIALMDRDGIQKAVVFPGAMERIPSTPDRLLSVFRFILRSRLNALGRTLYNSFVKQGNLMVSGKAYRIFPDPDNETVGLKVRENSDRLIFYAFINPKGSRNPVEVLEDCRAKFDVRGVKTHSWFHDFDPSQDLLGVAKRCEELALPFPIHLGGNRKTGNIEGLIGACPKLKVILAHVGIPYFQRIWPLLAKYPNLHMDISGPYLDGTLVAETVRAVGSRRLLFGTDSPYGLRHGDGYSFEPMKLWTEQLPISDKEKEDIFAGNLLRLLGG